MDRLYARALANVLAWFALGTIVIGLFVFPPFQRRLTGNVERILSVPAAELANRVAEERARGGDLDAALTRAARGALMPVELIARADARVEGEQAARLDRGEAVEVGPFREAVMLARVPGTERVLRMGPIHPVHPMGEGRGVAAVGLVMLGVVVGVYLVLLPIRRRIEGLAGHASRFGRGDLRARAVVGPPDAVAALESAFNRMAAEIERMVAAHQEMLRTVSHELRTPLQRMHFSLARAQDAQAAPERDEALERVDRGLDELDALVDELLTYARLQHGSASAHRAANLREMLADLCDRFDGMNGKAVELRAAALVITCDPHLLRRAATNLLVNAFEHARSRILVTAELRDGCAVLEVHDDGAGVATEDRERVFSPFWRSEERRAGDRGFGLGLAIVRQVARQHGGRAEVRAAPDLGGAAFRLTLPVGGASADARATAQAG